MTLLFLVMVVVMTVIVVMFVMVVVAVLTVFLFMIGLLLELMAVPGVFVLKLMFESMFVLVDMLLTHSLQLLLLQRYTPPVATWLQTEF